MLEVTLTGCSLFGTLLPTLTWEKCILFTVGECVSESQKNLLLLKPRGFCAGVVRAIDIVRIALEAFGPPIYVRKEIVHNRFVVEELQRQGRHLCRQRGRSARRASA